VVLGTDAAREGTRIRGDVELAADEAVVIRLEDAPLTRKGVSSGSEAEHA
jgi:hypothetical protein